MTADDIVNFDLLLRRETAEAHTVDTATYHLLTMNILRVAGCPSEFKNNNINFYDLSDKEVTRSCRVVL